MARRGRRRSRITAGDLAGYGSVANGTVDVDRAARGLGASKTEVRQAIRQAEAAQSNTFVRRISGPARGRLRRRPKPAGHAAGGVRARPAGRRGQRERRRAVTWRLAGHGAPLGSRNPETVYGPAGRDPGGRAARHVHQTRAARGDIGLPQQRAG